jgi:hypothetical protein
MAKQSYSNMGTQGFGVNATTGGPVSNRTGRGRTGLWVAVEEQAISTVALLVYGDGNGRRNFIHRHHKQFR